MQEFQSTKIFFLKDMLLTGVIFIIRQIKNTVPWTYEMEKKLLVAFLKKNCKKTTKKKSELKK